MTPEETFDAAAAALRAHELDHLKIQRQYEASLEKLKTLNRAASDAWRKMMDVVW
jgi:predicted secreted Zn-dependent protease